MAMIIMLKRSAYIKAILCDLKTLARNVPFIFNINALIKAHKLRYSLKKLKNYYKKEAEKRNFLYNKKKAIEKFRSQLLYINPYHRPKKKGDIKIFWVGANRDQDESGFLQALRRVATVIEFHNWKGTYGQWYWDENGHVQVYDRSIIALNDRVLEEQIVKSLRIGSIDLLIGQMWANYISIDALARVREFGIPIINISMDDRLPDNWGSQGGIRLGSVGLAPATNLVLTTSFETCSWYGVEGCPAIFWPLASDPELFSPDENSVRDIDVLFIGNKYGVRESIIQELKQRGVKVDCYGAGWPNGPATAKQSAELFKRAKIILGVGTVGYCDDVFTMKLRDFDAPMSGALYLTHRCFDLTQLYQEGIEIECYGKPEEAAYKIEYYLAHPKERSQIGQAGHRKALARDTWDYRLEETFRQLGFLDTSTSSIQQQL